MNSVIEHLRKLRTYTLTLATMVSLMAVNIPAVGALHTIVKVEPLTHRKVKSKQMGLLTMSQRLRQLSQRRTQSNVVDIAWQHCVVTWYSQGTITKTGTRVRNNWTCAVDPSVIPLGSVIEVHFLDGTTRRYHAEDTGGAVIGARIDIYNSNTGYCFREGRQVADYRILSRGSDSK